MPGSHPFPAPALETAAPRLPRDSDSMKAPVSGGRRTSREHRDPDRRSSSAASPPQDPLPLLTSLLPSREGQNGLKVQPSVWPQAGGIPSAVSVPCYPCKTEVTLRANQARPTWDWGCESSVQPLLSLPQKPRDVGERQLDVGGSSSQLPESRSLVPHGQGSRCQAELPPLHSWPHRKGLFLEANVACGQKMLGLGQDAPGWVGVMGWGVAATCPLLIFGEHQPTARWLLKGGLGTCASSLENWSPERHRW